MQFVRNFLAGAAVLGCSATALAAHPGPYADAVLGITSINRDCPNASCDNSDMGFRLGGGYMFNETYGISGGYLNLGKFSSSGKAAVAGISNVQLNTSLKSSGPYVAASVLVPLMPKLDLTGALGAFYGMNKTSATACASTVCGASSSKNNKVKPYVGLGIQYEIMKGLSAGGSLDLTEVVESGDSGSAMLLGAAVRYAF